MSIQPLNIINNVIKIGIMKKPISSPDLTTTPSKLPKFNSRMKLRSTRQFLDRAGINTDCSPIQLFLKIQGKSTENISQVMNQYSIEKIILLVPTVLLSNAIAMLL